MAIQACGWVKVRWNFSWQNVPRVMLQSLTGSDEAAKAPSFAATLLMVKMDIAALEAAVAS